MLFRSDPAKTDLTYQVQVATDLAAAATWTDLSDVLTGTSGNIEHRKASVPVAGGKKFLHLKITKP